MPRAQLTEDDAKSILTKCGGEGVIVETVVGTAIFRTPTADECVAWWVADSSAVRNDNLAAACVVHPTLDLFKKWLDRRPGIVADVVDRILASAGLLPDIERTITSEDDADGVPIPTAVVVWDPEDIVLRCPTGEQWRSYQRRLGDGGDGFAARDWLAKACSAPENRERMTALLKRFPLLSASLVPVIGMLAGDDAERRAKKRRRS